MSSVTGRGRQYFRNHLADIVRLAPGKYLMASASKGGGLYHVEYYPDEGSGGECECFYFNMYGLCKHMVAARLYEEMLQSNDLITVSRQTLRSLLMEPNEDEKGAA